MVRSLMKFGFLCALLAQSFYLENIFFFFVELLRHTVLASSKGKR